MVDRSFKDPQQDSLQNFFLDFRFLILRIPLNITQKTNIHNLLTSKAADLKYMKPAAGRSMPVLALVV